MIDFIIERRVTADMADGQPLPPYIDNGAIWRVVRRSSGRTQWRRIFLTTTASPVTDWRAAPGDQTRAP